MECWDTISQIAQKGDWAFSLDLEKGYMHVPLVDKFKNFTCFRVGDSLFRHTVMPFGLASAPRDFSLLVRKVLALFRKQGYRCSFFIDDLIFFAFTRQEAIALRDYVLRILDFLGSRVSKKKSLLEPGQVIAHVGFVLDLRDMRIFVPEKKILKMKELAIEVIKHHQQVPGRLLARLLGKLGSFRVACPEVVTLCRGMMRCLQQLPLRKNAWADEQEMRFRWRDYREQV